MDINYVQHSRKTDNGLLDQTTATDQYIAVKSTIAISYAQHVGHYPSPKSNSFTHPYSKASGIPKT